MLIMLYLTWFLYTRDYIDLLSSYIESNNIFRYFCDKSFGKISISFTWNVVRYRSINDKHMMHHVLHMWKFQLFQHLHSPIFSNVQMSLCFTGRCISLCSSQQSILFDLIDKTWSIWKILINRLVSILNTYITQAGNVRE